MESQVLETVREVLDHSHMMTEYGHHGSILLAGDPGIGKTTFVKTLSELLGMQLVTIEIPHISEEHLINIPFIVFNPENNQQKHDKIQLEPTANANHEKGTGYKLVLAHSNLYTLINNAKKVPDAKYLNHINNIANPHIKELFVQLGGTETKIPEEIEHARDNHNMILFMDEYWRQTSMRIRNVLREMLNNNIGIHKIPDDVYIIYASNMRDAGGLEPQPPNAQFRTVEFKPPRAVDWFKWFESEFKDKGHQHADVKPEILKAFRDGAPDADDPKKIVPGITDEDISHTDPSSQVRTSPRRWAQLLLYVNTAFPPANQKDATSLLHNVKNYFIHYSTEEYSEKLRDKVANIVANLIKTHTDLKNTKPTDKNEDSDWRTSFDHYIEQYKRANGGRKHVPVISGPPGIGKTMFAAQTAAKHGLRLIEVPASGLASEDVIGMPLPGEKTEKSISVKFSIPKLHKLIMDKIEKADKDYIESLGNDKEAILAYKNQRWKYLVFFDEINTVGDDKTFNALRRVILEKNFGPSDDKDSEGKHIDLVLPKEAIVFAAINPEGTHTREITDHFRDTIDIIPAKANWERTKEWLLSNPFKTKKGVKIEQSIKDVGMNILTLLIDKFETKDSSIAKNLRPFTFDIGAATLQISPREYSDMYIHLIQTLDMNVKQALKKMANDDTYGIDKIRKDIDVKIANSLEGSLNNSFYRETFIAERDEFAKQLPMWIKHLPDSTFGGLFVKKVETSKSLKDTLKHYLEGTKKIEQMPTDEHITNTNITLTDRQVIEEIISIFDDVLNKPETLEDFLLNETEKKVEVTNDETELIAGTELVTKCTNFLLGVVFTLHIYHFDNSRLNTISNAVGVGINAIRGKFLKEGKIVREQSKKIANALISAQTDIEDLIDELNKK